MQATDITRENQRQQYWLCDLCDVEPWERDEHEAEYGYPKHYLVEIYWDAEPSIQVHCAFCVWISLAGEHEGQVIRVLR